jgi:hypothetical protein
VRGVRQTLYRLRLIAVMFPAHADAVTPVIAEADELVAILGTIARGAAG